MAGKTSILAFILVVSSLLVLSACATERNTQAPVSDQPSASSVQKETETAKKIEEIAKKAPGCRIAQGSEANLRKMMENKDEFVRMALAVNSYLDVKVGECVIFPVGIRNGFPDTKEFFLELAFQGAKDRSPVANTLSADKRVMEGWLTETDFSKKTLASQEYAIIPVKIKVGDSRSADEKTSAGTYRFSVQAYYAVGDVSKTKYEPEREIFVRVLE